MWRYIRISSDPVVRAVAFEDSAALIGLLLAAAGLLFSKIFGTNVPDSLASLLIGLLLAVTAFALARPLADFLVGRSLPAELFEKLKAMIIEDSANNPGRIGSVVGHDVLDRERLLHHALLYKDYFSEKPTSRPKSFRHRLVFVPTIYVVTFNGLLYKCS